MTQRSPGPGRTPAATPGREPGRIRRTSSATARAKALLRRTAGLNVAVQRARAITALESKIRRGVRVYRLTCCGPFGKGPHKQFVPASLLWSLIGFNGWRCPFHAGGFR